MYNYSLGVQARLAESMVLDVSYVGNQTRQASEMARYRQMTGAIARVMGMA